MSVWMVSMTAQIHRSEKLCETGQCVGWNGTNWVWNFIATLFYWRRQSHWIHTVFAQTFQGWLTKNCSSHAYHCTTYRLLPPWTWQSSLWHHCGKYAIVATPKHAPWWIVSGDQAGNQSWSNSLLSGHRLFPGESSSMPVVFARIDCFIYSVGNGLSLDPKEVTSARIDRQWSMGLAAFCCFNLEWASQSWTGSHMERMETGWWFGTFFIFPYIGNDHPNWLSYFSEGFKAPTRRCRQNDKWHVTCDELAKHFRSTAIPLPDLSLSSMARQNHCFFMVIFWQCMAYFLVEFVGLASKSASFHRLFCISPHLGKYFETCNSSTADSL